MAILGVVNMQYNWQYIQINIAKMHRLFMDWNGLKTFLTIAREGSLSAASKKLGVNHSTVFRRLAQFEESVGSRLFDRIDNQYHLTEVGISLYSRGENIATEIDDLERVLSGYDKTLTGKVRITAPDNIAYRYLPKYFTGFHALYPEIEIELVVSNQDFSLTRREADIAVRATPNPPEHLIGRKICQFHWGVYTARNKRKLHAKNIADLDDYPLIGGDGHMSNLPAFQWLDKEYPSSQVARSNDLVAMAAMAEAGLGLAVLPDDQARPELKRLFECPQAQFSDLWLLTHADLRKVERIHLLMEYLSESFKSDPRIFGTSIGY